VKHKPPLHESDFKQFPHLLRKWLQRFKKLVRVVTAGRGRVKGAEEVG
jgi:hypothetical protein